MLAELKAAAPFKVALTPELVAYLQLASENMKALFDEEQIEPVTWRDKNGDLKTAEMPRVIFVR